MGIDWKQVSWVSCDWKPRNDKHRSFARTNCFSGKKEMVFFIAFVQDVKNGFITLVRTEISQRDSRKCLKAVGLAKYARDESFAVYMEGPRKFYFQWAVTTKQRNNWVKALSSNWCDCAKHCPKMGHSTSRETKMRSYSLTKLGFILLNLFSLLKNAFTGKTYHTHHNAEILHRPIITCSVWWNMVWISSSSTPTKKSQNGLIPG